MDWYSLKLKFPRLLNERGSALMLSYLVVLSCLILGAAFLIMGVGESRRTEVQQKTEQALYIAEAGLEQVLYELKEEFESGDGSWLDDVTIGGTDYAIVSPPTNPNSYDNFYTVYNQVTYPTGSYTHAFSNSGTNHYTVSLRNISGLEDMWIRSTGQVDNVTQTVQQYVRIVNVSPWNNAIFGGAGGTDGMVNGNVNIYGSVHILGEGLNPGAMAMDLGGDADLVGNNYNVGMQGLPQALKDLIPDLPTVDFGPDSGIDTLNAELRVKNGTINLDGNATVGEEDDPGNSTKETVDGVYSNHGFEDASDLDSVYSDNGTNTAYDLGDAVSFPSLSDPHPAEPTGDYYDYFTANGESVASDVTITPASSFTIGNCATANCLQVNGTDITVKGMIYITGTNTLSITGGDFTYTGSGTILAEGGATIDASLLTPAKVDGGGNPIATYPYDSSVSQANILGIMTPNDINIGSTAQEDIAGLLYAENEIDISKQTNLLGTIVTNFFDLSSQVPSIFQVPEIVNYLPPGMIADENVWYINTVSWQKCESHTATCGGVN